MTRLVVTGAGGFVGARVLRRVRHEHRDAPVRLLVHRRPVAAGPDPWVVQHRGDVADPRTLHGLCDGADVLLHCASQIGGPAEACEAVNARGTAALVAEALRAGVRRIVYLSTAAVYGRGPFRRTLPEDTRRNPASVTSRTRMAAEDAVLQAGGVVLRPYLVLGPGDRWVAPTLARITGVLQADASAWGARLSVIGVDDLARALVAAALAPATALGSAVYNATHPVPVRSGELLRTVARASGLPRYTRRMELDEARSALLEHGLSARPLDMIATDHWFDSGPLWDDLGLDPGPPFPAGLVGAPPQGTGAVRTVGRGVS